MATCRNSKPGNGTRSISDLEADIQLLKADIEILTQQLAAHRRAWRRRGTARRLPGRRTASGQGRGEPWRACARMPATSRRRSPQSVREKPITSLAIAAGVGFLFALIARR